MARRPSTRAIAAAGLGAVLAATAVLLARAVSPSRLAAAFAGADLRLVGAAVGLGLVAAAASVAVWVVAAHAAGVAVPPAHLACAQLAGQAAGCALPAKLGEGVRFAVARRHPEGRRAGAARLSGTMAAQRLLEGLVTFAVVCGVLAAAPLPAAAAGLRPVAASLLGAEVLAALAARRLGPARLAALAPARLRPAVEGLGRGLSLLARPRALAPATLLALAVTSARVGALAMLLAAFGAPAHAAPVAFCLLFTANLLPIAPGGAGVREAALVPALAAGWAVPVAQGLALSIAIQATAVLVAGVGALLAVAARGLAARRRPAAADQSVIVRW